jgi:putative hydrolases of HD superfamily
LNDIENILDFMVEIEKLKAVHRKSRPVGLDRYENSAEHSWHVCISALMLKDYANGKINIDRVIKMLLIHDLGEIDAGDNVIYKSETKEQKMREAVGVKRLLSFLSEKDQEEYMALWYEFEAGETADSKYAKAIDRVPPLLHNINDNGHTWRKNNITKEMVFSINSRIGEGSKTLWEAMKSKLEDAIDKGILV